MATPEKPDLGVPVDKWTLEQLKYYVETNAVPGMVMHAVALELALRCHRFEEKMTWRPDPGTGKLVFK